MTPKEKAIELYELYFYRIPFYYTEDELHIVAKKCALIAVDEILKELDHLPFDDQDFGTFKMKDWNEVKKEIEKI